MDNTLQSIVRRFGIPNSFWWFRDQDKIQIKINNPEFENTRRVHDWRSHVPDWAIKSWKHLSAETRVVIYVMCEELADKEEWD